MCLAQVLLQLVQSRLVCDLGKEARIEPVDEPMYGCGVESNIERGRACGRSDAQEVTR